MSTVNVVITTYNRARYLAEAIESVLSQTYHDFDIIVVDDGSTDDTRTVADSFAFPNLKYVYQKNQGPPTARNTGILAASGKYIAFLDADDLWLPHKLELQIKALESSPRAGVVYCDMYFFGITDSSIPLTYFQSLKWPPPRGVVLEKMAQHSFGIPSTLLIRREIFHKIGLFDSNLPYCDDYDMLLRLADTCEFEVVNLPCVKYRFHPEQVSKNQGPVLAEHIQVFRKALTSPGSAGHVFQILKRRLADTHFQYAIFLIRRGNRVRGLQQLWHSMQTDIWRIFPSSISLIKRTAGYLYRHFLS